MRARMFSPMPVLVFEIVFVNCEVPPTVTPGLTASEDKVGTELPTVMEAGILSVAITLGADSTLVFDVLSLAWSRARSWRVCPTSNPEVNVRPPAAALPRSWVPVIPAELAAPFCCRNDSTPRENAPVRSTS